MSAPPFDEDDDASDAEMHSHAALFEHVGVTDPTDWQTVAIRLAERYAPAFLHPPNAPPAHRKGGRPELRGPARLSALSFFIELIRDASEKGRMRPDLKTTKSICRFIASKHPDAVQIREMLDLPPNVSPRTIENLISRLRRENPNLVVPKSRY